MKTTLSIIAVFAALLADSAWSQGHAIYSEDFDSSSAATSVGDLPNWTSPGTGAYDTDALILEGYSAEPAHSAPNYMRLVGYSCVDVDATWHVQAPGSINSINLSFYYELQPNITASVSIAANASGPFVDAGLDLVEFCDNSLSGSITADLSHLIETVGIDQDLYVRWSGTSCNGTSCTVFNVDSVSVALDYQQGTGWTPAPSFNIRRAGFAVVEHGGDIYIAGGDTQSCDGVLQIPEVERFDGTQWTVVSNMPNGGRTGMKAVSLDGYIYFFGGYIPLVGSTDEVWRYDPCNDQWTECAPMGEAHPTDTGHRVNMDVIVRDGKILVIGGRSWPGWTYHNTVFVYDPALDSWSTGVEHPGRVDGFPLGDNTAVGVFGRILILGGMSGTGSFSDAYDDIWLYDPWKKSSSAAFRLVASLPEALFGSLVETFGEMMFVMGGSEAWNGSGNSLNDQMHVYDVSPGNISYRFSLPLPDHPQGSAVLGQGADARLYIIGTRGDTGNPCISTECWSMAIR